MIFLRLTYSLKFLKWLPALLLIGILLPGCAVGPDYVKPNALVAQSYKESDGWKIAQPSEELPRGNWWGIYNDPVLDQLMNRVDINNQNLIGAEAQYRQATALLQQARAGLFPVVGANASENRGSVSNTNSGFSSAAQTNNVNLNASWIPDIWGQVRRSIESSSANAQATAAQVDAARLSIQATLAQSYFQLRIADMQKRMYEDTLKAYEKSLEITLNQYNAGIVTQLDVAQARTIYESTLALAIDIGLARAQVEHAIAVLVGETPSSFSLAPQPMSIDPVTGLVVSPVSKLVANLPEVPSGLPSQLLERRPDIAAAERQMAAANARIGVAKAAFFPTISISAAAGYQGAALPGLISLPFRYWSIGPSLAQTVFDGGARLGALNQADAAYDQAVATYRQTVLTAFQNVEDNLIAVRLLQKESKAQADAVKHAQDAVRISLNQYKSGITTYLTVVTSQTSELNNERSLMSLLNRHMSAHVGLITALGGGWDAQMIASK